MTSQRHNGESAAARDRAARTPADDYLDAARACILDVGWRRTTLTEVARRAGVSRMTIYRTWSDMPQLLGDLMTREWSDVVAATDPGGTDAPGPEQVADGVLEVVRALRENELFVRIVELDPELILPYLLARRGRSQELLCGLLADSIAAGQRRRTIRRGDPTAMARALVLAAHGFVLSAHTMCDDDVTAEAIDAELRLLVARSLAPAGRTRGTDRTDRTDRKERHR